MGGEGWGRGKENGGSGVSRLTQFKDAAKNS